MQPLVRNYFKNGCLTKTDKLLALFFPKIVYSVNAKKIVSAFNQDNHSPDTSNKTVSVSIANYPHSNKQVIDLGLFLQQNLLHDLAGAYVHGSVATDELIPYSDLDALVIIKDKVFDDKKRLLKVALKLKDAETFMFKLDALQHHGWFVIAERDLLNYDNNYFPVELFEYCKSIFPSGLLKFNFNVAPNNYSASSINICNRISKITASGKCPSTVYELKNLLSEFMLMPALYVQARDRKAIFKKFSFEKAKVDFTKEEWNIMDEVSEIRELWKQENISAHSERLAERFSIIPLVSNLIRAKVSSELKQKINSAFLKRMNLLAESMRTKIERK